MERKRLEKLATVKKDNVYFSRRFADPEEAVFVASTVGVGSPRIRANHVDAVIDFFAEQEALKKQNAKM